MGISRAKKFVLLPVFLMVCGLSFARDIKVIGAIPSPDTGKTYQLQIGAFGSLANANRAVETLTKYGLVPRCEKVTDPKHGVLTRVFVVASAKDVRCTIDLLGRAGFREVIIREYPCKAADDKPPQPRPPEPKPPEPEPSKPELPKPEFPKLELLDLEPDPAEPSRPESPRLELLETESKLPDPEAEHSHLFLLLYSREIQDTRRFKPAALWGV